MFIPVIKGIPLATKDSLSIQGSALFVSSSLHLVTNWKGGQSMNTDSSVSIRDRSRAGKKTIASSVVIARALYENRSGDRCSFSRGAFVEVSAEHDGSSSRQSQPTLPTMCCRVSALNDMRPRRAAVLFVSILVSHFTCDLKRSSGYHCVDASPRLGV